MLSGDFKEHSVAKHPNFFNKHIEYTQHHQHSAKITVKPLWVPFLSRHCLCKVSFFTIKSYYFVFKYWLQYLILPFPFIYSFFISTGLSGSKRNLHLSFTNMFLKTATKTYIILLNVDFKTAAWAQPKDEWRKSLLVIQTF